eukprot:3912946-Rhodomonas_salina.1
MASLQGFFIRERRSSAGEVVKRVRGFIAEEVAERGEGEVGGSREKEGEAVAERRSHETGGSQKGRGGREQSKEVVGAGKENGPAVFVSTEMDPGWS